MKRLFFGLACLFIISCTSSHKKAHEFETPPVQRTSASEGQLHKYEKADPKEAIYIGALAKAFGAKAKASGLRGTHSKGVCAQADFEVYDLRKSPFAQGVFKIPGKYPTRVRFANAEGSLQDDNKFDPRALSMVVDLGDGVRQDFVLQNSPIFPLPNLQDFALVVFLKVNPAQALALTGLSQEEVPQHLARVNSLVATFPKTVKSYLTETYWSETSYALGEEDAVKYVVSPCAKNKSIATKETGPDFLQEIVRKHLSADSEMACFEFGVQMLNAAVMTDSEGKSHPAHEWVEDTGLEWDKSQVPVSPVGKITLRRNSVLDPQVCDDPANAVNVMKYTLPENRGLGQINRGRQAPEQASAAARSK